MGRPPLGPEKRGKLTLSISRETIESAREKFPGEISGMVEEFLAAQCLREAEKGGEQ